MEKRTSNSVSDGNEFIWERAPIERAIFRFGVYWICLSRHTGVQFATLSFEVSFSQYFGIRIQLLGLSLILLSGGEGWASGVEWTALEESACAGPGLGPSQQVASLSLTLWLGWTGGLQAFSPIALERRFNQIMER